MAKNNLPAFETIYSSNLDLLQLVRQEKWDEFNLLAESYIISLRDFFDNQAKDLTAEEIGKLKDMWESVLQNEAEMFSKLTGRLDVLKKEMSTLRQGNKCSKAYSSQMLSACH